MRGPAPGRGRRAAGRRGDQADVRRPGRPWGRLGTRLLSHLTDLAREAGLSRLVLDTRDELAEARRLYVRHGFVEVGPYNANPYARNWYAKDLW